MTDETTPQDDAAMSPASDGSLAWIPVTERLPPINGGILVCVKSGDEGSFVDAAHFFEGMWWTGESPAAKYPFRITHWMPLPAPPTSDK